MRRVPMCALFHCKLIDLIATPTKITVQSILINLLYCLFMFLFAWFDLNDDNIRVVVGVI